MGPNPLGPMSLSEERSAGTRMGRQDSGYTEARWTYEDASKVGVMLSHVKRRPGCQRLEEARKRPPQRPGGRAAVLMLWSWTSGLQNSKTMHFCRFKPPGLWYLVTVKTGAERHTDRYSGPCKSLKSPGGF